jgi:hypothetical protein
VERCAECGFLYDRDALRPLDLFVQRERMLLADIRSGVGRSA